MGVSPMEKIPSRGGKPVNPAIANEYATRLLRIEANFFHRRDAMRP
jgi:hypothetical protein